MSELKQRDLPNWDVSRINAWASIICTLYQGFLNFLSLQTLFTEPSGMQRGVNGATDPGIQGRGGIQRVKLQKLKCCN